MPHFRCKITNIYKSNPFKEHLYVSIDTLFIVNSDGFISILESIKVIMQGKLIAVAYTLCTYWNQFPLGGICKQK